MFFQPPLKKFGCMSKFVFRLCRSYRHFAKLRHTERFTDVNSYVQLCLTSTHLCKKINKTAGKHTNAFWVRTLALFCVVVEKNISSHLSLDYMFITFNLERYLEILDCSLCSGRSAGCFLILDSKFFWTFVCGFKSVYAKHVSYQKARGSGSHPSFSVLCPEVRHFTGLW